MPFHFECPHCGKQTYVDDRYGGQSGPCSGCGNTVTVPLLGRGAGTSSPTATGSGAVVIVVVALGLIGLLFCGGLGWFWARAVGPAIPGPTATVAAMTPCTSNLKALALAMHSYHDTYGTFPPAYVADDEGIPMHSWRVLLLPHLGRQDLYDQYDFDEPWDGPNNSALISMIPVEYRCPDDMLGGYDQTSYAMIVGPGMFSEGRTATRMGDIQDGASNTLMLVEAHGAGIAWTEPRDLDAATLSFRLNTNEAGQLQGHGDHVKAALCDGSVRDLPNWTTPEDVRAMATIAGGEAVAIP